MNEINVLHKLAVWSMRPNQIQQVAIAQACQTLMILRLLVGKLNEANELVRRAYNATQLSREYHAQLAPEARDAAREINRYLGKTNLIQQVHNSVAFHYSAEAMDGALQQISSDDGLEVFVAERLPNMLYVFSETLVTHTMLGDEGLSGFDRFMHEAINVSRWFLRFLDGFVTAFVVRHGERLFEGSGDEKHEISVATSFEDAYIPWFTEVAVREAAPTQPFQQTSDAAAEGRPVGRARGEIGIDYER